MGSRNHASTWSVLAALMLVPLAAAGQITLTGSFSPSPAIAGETMTLTITETGNWRYYNPNCKRFWVCPWIRIYWGDGTHNDWEDYDCPPFKPGSARTQDHPYYYTFQHSYSHPGRFQVSLYARFDLLTTYPQPYCPPVYVVFDQQVGSIDVLPSAQEISNGWIGVYFDTGASVCGRACPPGTMLYVIANLAGLTANGITGAEFRVRSSDPAAFQFLEQAPSEWTIKLGNAFGDGTTMATPECLTGSEGRVVLLQALAMPQTQASDVQLYLEPRREPSNPNYTMPVLVLCDDVRSAILVGRAFPAILNPSGGSFACPQTPAPIAVQERTWSQVKDLYR